MNVNKEFVRAHPMRFLSFREFSKIEINSICFTFFKKEYSVDTIHYDFI